MLPRCEQWQTLERVVVSSRNRVAGCDEFIQTPELTHTERGL